MRPDVDFSSEAFFAIRQAHRAAARVRPCGRDAFPIVGKVGSPRPMTPRRGC